MNHTRTSCEAGFTLVEAMIVAAAMVPILLAVFGTTRSVSTAMDTMSQLAVLDDHIDQVVDRFGRLSQKAIATTLRTRANQADVDAALADPLVVVKPALGDWTVPQDFTDRSSVQFHAVRGDLSFNAAQTEGPFALEFELESGELANGLDDDGDGLIDEGRVLLRAPATETTVLPRVERFSVSIDGSLVTVQIVAARTDKQRRVHRAMRVRRYHVRNM